MYKYRGTYIYHMNTPFYFWMENSLVLGFKTYNV